MIRNPKAFEAWFICSFWVYSVITKLEMLPKEIMGEGKKPQPRNGYSRHEIYLSQGI
jgi:hypothetical protein